MGDPVVLEPERPAAATVRPAGGGNLLKLAAHPATLARRLVRRHRTQHPKHEQAVTAGHVDLGAGHELQTGANLGEHVHEVLQHGRLTGEPVLVIDEHAIPAPFRKVLQHPLVLGPALGSHRPSEVIRQAAAVVQLAADTEGGAVLVGGDPGIHRC